MSLAALSEHDLAHWRGSARRAQAALETRLFIDGQFVDVSNQMTIARGEIFVPVASVIPFSGVDEAVAIANDTIYGLAAGVWTRDIDVAFRLVREIEAGVIWINSFDEGDMTQPFGGYKQSGQARDKCLDSFLSYTQTKSAWFRLASP